ncbi:MAG: phosphoribosyltransferase family protein [Candidatus Methanomethylicaceae archaeon]|jgi:predicted phosphoribosyltransferase
MAEIVDEPIFRNRTRVFDDRIYAGELLAKKLQEYKCKKDAYILAIPAGGVQVAFIVSKRLKIPLDLTITRKLHVPWNREVGFGAVSWDGTIFLNEPLIASLGLTRDDIDRCVVEEKEVIRRRLKKFRGDKPFPDLKDKTAIIVDDGLASGFSMLTTLKTIEQMGAKEIIVAVPTAPISAINLIRSYADKVVCLNIRSGPVFAVAVAYKEWYDLEDDDVMDILKLR